MKKLKKKILDALEIKIENILFGTGLNRQEANIVTKRSIGLWSNIRPYLFIFSFSLIIFFFFPKMLFSENKIIIILLFMIFAHNYFLFRKLEKYLKEKNN